MPVLEAAAGIAWCHNNWEFSGGYEMSVWFNQAVTYTYYINYNDNSGGFTRTYQDTLLDGFFGRIAYKF